MIPLTTPFNLHNLNLGQLPSTTLSFLNKVHFRVVQQRHELEAASRLVYEEYLKRGYIAKPNPAGLRLTLHNALPQTTTFVALLDQQVIGALTLIPDSPIGLPMDHVYRKELDGLRAQGQHLAEVIMLAVKTELFGKSVFLMLNTKKLFVVFSLFKMLFDYTRFLTSTTTLCIAIHPKHALMYRFLYFRDLAEERSYPGANNHPAIAKIMNIPLAIEACRAENKLGLHKMFLSKPCKPDQLADKLLLTADDLHELFVEKTQVFSEASTEQRRYVKQCYPSYRLPFLE